jgi:hypothetical protein
MRPITLQPTFGQYGQGRFENMSTITGKKRLKPMGTHFLCRHGPQDNGTLFLFRTTRNCASGEWPPALEDVVEGGVGVILNYKLHTVYCEVITKIRVGKGRMISSLD